ncbi:MAG: isopentenyl phosphate kinase [Elusimicrobiota bacterium]
MSKLSVFVKLGGSFITDKNVADSLAGPRIETAARMIGEALGQSEMSLVLGHGAGSYGHILAQKYDAVRGVHPELGWEGYYKIRESMTEMNLRFVRHCGAGGLHPVTISPHAVAAAADGRLERIDTRNISELLKQGQIPLLHGDIVPDRVRGFTIASTEALLAGLAEHMRFDRVVMISDTVGVLDEKGRTIEMLDDGGFAAAAEHIGGAGAPDVTGGMRRKVEQLFSLIRAGRIGEARITTCAEEPENLRRAILGDGGGGTLLQA